MEDELSANKVKLDLALVGYGVDPSLSPTSQGFPGFPGLDCIKKSPHINLVYFDAGKDDKSLDKATQDSLIFLESGTYPPAQTNNQCTLAIFCNNTININIGVISFASLVFFHKKILKFIRNMISIILTGSR